MQSEQGHQILGKREDTIFGGKYNVCVGLGVGENEAYLSCSLYLILLEHGEIGARRAWRIFALIYTLLCSFAAQLSSHAMLKKTLLHTLLGIAHARHASIHTISMLLVDFIVLTLTHNLVDLVDFPALLAY